MERRGDGGGRAGVAGITCGLEFRRCESPAATVDDIRVSRGWGGGFYHGISGSVPGASSSASVAVASVALSQASSSPVTSTTRTTPRAAVHIRRTWGDEVTPQHDAEGRKKRRLGLEREVERRRARLAANAAAEEEALRRLSQRYPGPVEEGVLLKKDNVHTCRQHAHTRCEDCALASTPLNECCAEHHGVEGDTSEVRIDFCSAHRWTSCGDCVQAGTAMPRSVAHDTTYASRTDYPRARRVRGTRSRSWKRDRSVVAGSGITASAT